MSITAKELKRITELLKHGDLKRIALSLSVSQPWVSKVLADTDLAEKHPNVINAALDLIELNKSESVIPKIKERIKQLTR